MRGIKHILQEQADLRNEADAIRGVSPAARTPEQTARLDAILGKPTGGGAREAGLLAAVELDLADAQASAEEIRRAPAATVDPTDTVHVRAEDKPFASFGEQLVAIAAASAPHGAVIDPRLKLSDGKGGIFAAASGASQGTAADGGFLVETAYSDALLARAREDSPILGMCRQIPMPDGAESLDLPVIDETSRATGSRWGGVQVYRKAEADTVTATKPTFGKLKIIESEIMGIAYATERLLRNAATVEAVFGNAFASEFAFKVTDEVIRGTGGDECLGILREAAPTVSQAKETGQAAATITAVNLSQMWTHVPARSRTRGVWLANGECDPQFDQLAFAVGLGGMAPNFVSYRDGQVFIKGRPVITLEQCAALGTVGDIIFADLNEYILSPKGGIQGASSMHVRFLYNEMTFRWNYYINGRPAWLSKVSAYKGSADLSPFVTLATRA